MNAKKNQNKKQGKGLLNLVNLERTTLNALRKIKRAKRCSYDDLVKEAIVNYLNGFNKPI